MYLFANSLDWERNFNFVQSMCRSLDFEECSKPKFKSVGLHFTVPQIDKVWNGSAHSHNMVGGVRGRVCNFKCRFIFKQSGNCKMYTHHINFDAFSYDVMKISWWFDEHLRFPAKMSRWPWRPTRYEMFDGPPFNDTRYLGKRALTKMTYFTFDLWTKSVDRRSTLMMSIEIEFKELLIPIFSYFLAITVDEIINNM